MGASKKMRVLRVRGFDYRRNDPVFAQRDFEDLPDDVVHNVLGFLMYCTGGTISRLDGGVAVEIYLSVSVGEEEFPF